MSHSWNELFREHHREGDDHNILLAAVIHNAAAEICCRLDQLVEKGGQIVAELDDLNKAVADIQLAVTAVVTDLTAIAAALKAAITPTGVDPAAVEAAATSLEASAQALNDAVAANPAPTPPTP